MESCLPEVNIGLIGHVDHGKTTLTDALSGIWTDTHSEEKKRGITIKLGYADCTFYKCPKCKAPQNYTTKEKCPNCKSKTKLLRIVSFVDAPGHETLMATMLSGAALMDGALLVIAANEPCPQPQTKEHLMALEIMGVDKIVIAQNKVDAISEKEAKENYKQIKNFVKGTIAENAPIIPVSAQLSTNIDVLIKEIEDVIKTPEEKAGDPLMLIARSFDVNKPGSAPKDLKGGVLGGALLEGELKKGEDIEVCPGGAKTKIKDLICGRKKVEKVTRGGTFGIETLLDPALTKGDRFAGKILGLPGKLPPVLEKISLEVKLLEKVLGSKEELEVKPLFKAENLMLNIGTSTTLGIVTSSDKKGTYSFDLKMPICARKGARVTIARRYGTRWRLIGYGRIV